MANSNQRSLEDIWHKHESCELVLYYNPWSNGDKVPVTRDSLFGVTQ